MEEPIESIKLRIKKYLELENVSFLFGAGSSFHLGAPVIRTIPQELKEQCLAEITHYFDEGANPSYEDLFNCLQADRYLKEMKKEDVSSLNKSMIKMQKWLFEQCDTNKTEGFNEILLYTTPNGSVKIEIYLQDETVWLTQHKITDLFGVQRPAITKHLKNIIETGELKEELVSSILEHTTSHGAIEGKTQTAKTKYYNLDAIISVDYRVNSTYATTFIRPSGESITRSNVPLPESEFC